ncbi:MAG TPA: 8-amino-7-oxononanoate synthase [Vicinamibacterales bacterium]|nr:8-amino-7-oxononanoate synthase [Vicinamibacterales bacterium]
MSSLDNELACELESRAKHGLTRRLRSLEHPGGCYVYVDGKIVTEFASNNYLGLAFDPVTSGRVTESDFGSGSTGSRLVTGNYTVHEELECAIAALKATDAALIFPSGYQAAVGTIPALVGRNDLILSDQHNHACLIDGCRLSRATVRVYDHNEPKHARALLSDRAQFRRCLIVTDGVFSMDGDIADLPALADLRDEFDAWLMVDDAHGTGVLGETGAGSAEFLGVRDRVDVHMGTMSKALGCAGGFIAGSRTLIDHLIGSARSFMFSTAPAPVTSGSAIGAINAIRDMPERREKVLDNARFLRAGLRALGFSVPHGDTPIIPVLIGSAQAAVALADALLDQDIYVVAIRPPTVPDGTSRLRVTVTALHTRSDLDTCLDAFDVAIRRLGWMPRFAG